MAEFTIQFRANAEIKAALEDAAKADSRTMSSYLRNLLIVDLQQKGLLPPITTNEGTRLTD